MEANASRYHGKAAGRAGLVDAQRQKRAVAEYLAGLRPRRRSRKAGTAAVAVLTGSRPQSANICFPLCPHRTKPLAR